VYDGWLDGMREVSLHGLRIGLRGTDAEEQMDQMLACLHSLVGERAGSFHVFVK